MIKDLPIYIPILFILITIYAVFAFVKSNNLKKHTLPLLIIWAVLVSVLAINKVYDYREGDVIPRFAFILLPVILFVIYFARDKSFYRNRNLKWSTAIHIIRFPVELLLLQLGLRELLPMEMTFQGWNFDIIPGITSIILVLWMQFGTVNRKLLLGWNIMGLFFIFFILSNGFLSQEMLYERFGYAVPNTAITYFPMILLAGVLVPIVIYTHISDIILLSKRKQ